MVHFDNYKNLNEYGGDLGGWLVGDELILFLKMRITMIIIAWWII